MLLPVWSGLGSSMGVSSVVREELEKLRVELRDTKLEVARDISELREVIHNIGIEMEQVVQKEPITDDSPRRTRVQSTVT